MVSGQMVSSESPPCPPSVLGADVSDIFLFFFCFGGRGQWAGTETKRGGPFHLENEKCWVSEERRRGGAHRAPGVERVSAGGGGAKYFFGGAEIPTKCGIQGRPSHNHHHNFHKSFASDSASKRQCPP